MREHIHCGHLGPVLHVVPKSPTGGALAVVSSLVASDSLSGRFSRVVLLAGGDERPIIHTLNCPVEELPYVHSFRHPFRFLSTVYALSKIARRSKSSLFHAHLGQSALLCMAASRFTGIPVVVHQHDAYASERDRSARSRLLRWGFSLLARSSAVWFVAVSPNAREHVMALLGSTKRPVDTIPNGVDVARFHPLTGRRTAEGYLIGSAARLVPGKGLDLLIDAVALLRHRDGIDVRAAIAGDGSEYVKLVEHATRRGVSDAIDFCGLVVDMPEFYRSLDVFVLPSWSEGLPITVLESLSSGVPVVATSVGGIEEILAEGGGVCVPPGDTSALASNVREILLDESRRSLMSKAARQTAITRYSVEMQVLRIVRIQDGVRRCEQLL